MAHGAPQHMHASTCANMAIHTTCHALSCCCLQKLKCEGWLNPKLGRVYDVNEGHYTAHADWARTVTAANLWLPAFTPHGCPPVRVDKWITSRFAYDSYDLDDDIRSTHGMFIDGDDDGDTMSDAESPAHYDEL